MISHLIIALCKVQTVTFEKLANAFDTQVDSKSSLRRIQRFGIQPDQAYAWSRTNLDSWRTAQSPILGTTITLKRLKLRGYISLLDYHKKTKYH